MIFRRNFSLPQNRFFFSLSFSLKLSFSLFLVSLFLSQGPRSGHSFFVATLRSSFSAARLFLRSLSLSFSVLSFWPSLSQTLSLSPSFFLSPSFLSQPRSILALLSLFFLSLFFLSLFFLSLLTCCSLSFSETNLGTPDGQDPVQRVLMFHRQRGKLYTDRLNKSRERTGDSVRGATVRTLARTQLGTQLQRVPPHNCGGRDKLHRSQKMDILHNCPSQIHNEKKKTPPSWSDCGMLMTLATN